MLNKDGVKTSSICGKKVTDCKIHAKSGSGACSYQYAMGSYPRVPVARGFEGHGLASGPPCYMDEQIQALKAEGEKEMERLVQAMSEDASNADDMKELARDLQVRFEPPMTQPTQNRSQTLNRGPTDDLRKA
jgi:hypothetical protein